MVTGGVITLPYTETPLAKVGVSSRTTNLNPFLVVKWNGTMHITPAVDTWVEVVDLPEIFKTVERTITVQVPVWIPAPVPAPAPAPSPSPFVTGPFNPNPRFVIGPGSSTNTSATIPTTVVGPTPAASTNTSGGSNMGVSGAMGAQAPAPAPVAAPAPAPTGALPWWWLAEEGRA